MKYNDKEIEQRVFEQVSDLLHKKGIRGWNMDRLSEQSGLAKNTLYKIIGSKEDVIEKVVLQQIHHIQSRLVAVMQSEDDYLSALECVITLFPELINTFYAEHMQEIFNEYPRIEKSVRRHRDEMTSNIIGFMRKGVGCGVLREDLNPIIVFDFFQAVVMHSMKSGLKRQEISEHIAVSFRYLLDGIRMP